MYIKIILTTAIMGDQPWNATSGNLLEADFTCSSCPF